MRTGKNENAFDQSRGEGLELVWLEGFGRGLGLLSSKMLPIMIESFVASCEKVKNKARKRK
jgi:hypothetical protein